MTSNRSESTRMAEIRGCGSRALRAVRAVIVDARLRLASVTVMLAMPPPLAFAYSHPSASNSWRALRTLPSVRGARRNGTPNTDGPRAGVMFAGFFRRDDKHQEAISDRLKALASQAPNLDPDPADEESKQPNEARPIPRAMAALLFVAGPRAGERIVLEQGSVAFDKDGRALPDGSALGVILSVWPQGERYMLRDNGGVTVSGVRPGIPVVTLDDGDEISWGPHRLRFQLLPPEEAPPPPPESPR